MNECSVSFSVFSSRSLLPLSCQAPPRSIRPARSGLLVPIPPGAARTSSRASSRPGSAMRSGNRWWWRNRVGGNGNLRRRELVAKIAIGRLHAAPRHGQSDGDQPALYAKMPFDPQTDLARWRAWCRNGFFHGGQSVGAGADISGVHRIRAPAPTRRCSTPRAGTAASITSPWSA